MVPQWSEGQPHHEHAYQRTCRTRCDWRKPAIGAGGDKDNERAHQVSERERWRAAAPVWTLGPVQKLGAAQAVGYGMGGCSAPTSTAVTPSMVRATPQTSSSQGATRPGPLSDTVPAQHATEICASRIFGCANSAA